MMQTKPEPNKLPLSAAASQPSTGVAVPALSSATLAQDLGMIVASDAMRRLLILAERVARSNATVLITGPSGAGKELIARAIHQCSSRSKQPFIDLNCAALPEHLVESELFGYEKGAFSGADQSKPGLFEMADKGTLFLDEIGELDPKIQVKLLRVLDGMPFYRLGGKNKVSPNVRVVTATNRDLHEAAERGSFRADLFHRLSNFQLLVPALAERPEDIVPIANFFLSQQQVTARFSEAAADALTAYGWPGNIRELRNAVTHAAMTVEGDTILPSHLPAKIASLSTATVSHKAKPRSVNSLEELERQAIDEALRHTDGNQGRAAERLGISRRTLSRKLQSYRQPLGVMSSEQTTKYRANCSIPVEVHSSKGIFQLTTLNISEQGLSFNQTDSFQVRAGETFTVSFEIGAGDVLLLHARVAWTNNGRTGIEFKKLEAGTRERLEAFLKNKIEEEGWAIA